MRKVPKYPLRPDEKEVLYDEHKGICHRCGAVIDRIRDKWHTGHVIDRGCGGGDDWDNLRPEHSRCNLGYAAEVGNTLAAKIKRVRHLYLGNREQSPWSKRYHAMKKWLAEQRALKDQSDG